MHKEYILLNGFRKAKKGFTAGSHVTLKRDETENIRAGAEMKMEGPLTGMIENSRYHAQGDGGER